jgi:hypothetical protein
MQMLLDLMDERQKWLSQRDEAVREISRLSELIRATMNMIPAEQIARYEPIFERLENRPMGLSMAIRTCFTAGSAGGTSGREAEGGKPERGKAEGGRLEATATGSGKEDKWLTPVEIRDALKRLGFPFENYKANPLASIHTTLKRMVPAEMDVKTLKDGQKVYRLKSAGQWAEALAEARQWVKDNREWHKTVVIGGGGSLLGARPRNKEDQEQGDKPDQQEPPEEGAKRGTSGGA